MRKALIITVVLSLAFLFASCGSSEPGPVKVIAAAEDLAPLTGEWTGTYDSATTSRTGSITFHLTEDPAGAHGDVVMVPKRDFVNDREQHPPQNPLYPHGMMSSASVLTIDFVRIAGGKVTGKIAPYSDPDVPEAILETHFTGQVDGEWIEGTFVTYSDHGVSPRRGTWRVHRKPAPHYGNS